MEFKINAESLINGLLKFATKEKVALSVYADICAKKLEEDAKKNAKWIDRTGLSRQTIQGGTQKNGDGVDVYIAGNTEQMPFLELAHEKKYAILQPTIDKNKDKILKGLDNLLGK
ncbi:hypothetical protein [Clostridium scatologenes]|uniref:Phage protein, HK97 gp10 family n=1 Tax=Clostridium scatologenes TaxID=1548 RepID=A0A0E3JPB0_CLOSL|nr:hypothetical protein [Clostridium scatologenes]AKA70135.1 hypothetical protein CSCA_3010 [Clostridium scatologenes]